MFAKQHEPAFAEDLQIQMRVLKGNHMMLKKRFNQYFEGNRHKTSEEYSELFQSLQELHTVMAQVSWQLYVYDLRPKKKRNFLK
jgi:hypothetical protein